jgi:ABC-type antimicrobial peptide transport system permease subunit
LERYTQEDLKQYGVKRYFKQYYLNGTSFTVKKTLPKSSYATPTLLRFTDTRLLKDYVADGYSFDDDYGEYIPVIAPPATMGAVYHEEAEATNISQSDELKQLQFYKEKSKDLIGQKFDLYSSPLETVLNLKEGENLNSQATNVKIIIIGVNTSQSSLIDSYSLYLPLTAIENSSLQSIAKQDQWLGKLILDVEKNVDFVDDKSKVAAYRSEEVSPLQYFEDNIDLFISEFASPGIILVAVISFFSLLVFIFLFGKTVVDDQQEIGIFKEAKISNKRIYLINYLFGFFIINLSFVLSLGVSYSLLFIASHLFRKELLLFILGLASTTNLEINKPLLVSYPLDIIGLTYLAICMVSVLVVIIPFFKISRMKAVDGLKK